MPLDFREDFFDEDFREDDLRDDDEPRRDDFFAADLRPEDFRPEERFALDFLPDERPREFFVSPRSRRSLLTVRAAISSAVSSLLPRSSYDSLMCSY